MMRSPSPDEASAALSHAEASRSRLAEQLALPTWFYGSIGAAVALQIATTSIGLAGDGFWAGLSVVAGLLVLLVVCGVQLARFRRLNGVWVGGLASRLVGGTATPASISYGLAFGASAWAAFEGQWWLVPICSVLGGVAYVVCGRLWLRSYRADPQAHGRGDSAVWLAVLVLAAAVGLVLLAVGS